MNLDSLFELKPHIITAHQVEIEDLIFERDAYLNAYINYLIDQAFIIINRDNCHD